MLDNLENLKQEYAEIEKLLAQEEVFSDPEKLQQHSKRYNELKEIIGIIENIQDIDKQIHDLQNTQDKEIQDLVEDELQQLTEQRKALL